MAIAPTQRGFALLIAIIFMSVILAFGLALGSLAYKQQVLASSTVESQYAFYAADTALECALYADQQLNTFAYTAAPPYTAVLNCDGLSSLTTTYSYSADGHFVVENRLSLDGGAHCADVSVYKPNGTGTTYIFSQGYDVSCATVTSPNGARYVSRGITVHY